MASPDSAQSGASPVPSEKMPTTVDGKKYFCQRCLNHDLFFSRKGHKPHCRYSTCSCTQCIMVENRRQLNNMLQKRKVIEVPVEVKDGRKVRAPKCARCNAHGVIVQLRGHKKTNCPFSVCSCEACLLVGTRRELMARQIKLRRDQARLRGSAEAGRSSVDSISSSTESAASSEPSEPVPSIPTIRPIPKRPEPPVLSAVTVLSQPPPPLISPSSNLSTFSQPSPTLLSTPSTLPPPTTHPTLSVLPTISSISLPSTSPFSSISPTTTLPSPCTLSLHCTLSPSLCSYPSLSFVPPPTFVSTMVCPMESVAAMYMQLFLNSLGGQAAPPNPFAL